MNPLAVLLPALYAALASPALIWDSQPVRAYEHLPDNIPTHYVLIEQPTDADIGGSRGCQRYSCTVLLDVITQFATDLVSSVPVESLVSQIHERLRGQRLPLPKGWGCAPGVLLLASQLNELDGELLATRRLLRYRWDLTYTPPLASLREEFARSGHETTTSYGTAFK